MHCYARAAAAALELASHTPTTSLKRLPTSTHPTPHPTKRRCGRPDPGCAGGAGGLAGRGGARGAGRGVALPAAAGAPDGCCGLSPPAGLGCRVCLVGSASASFYPVVLAHLSPAGRSRSGQDNLAARRLVPAGRHVQVSAAPPCTARAALHSESSWQTRSRLTASPCTPCCTCAHRRRKVMVVDSSNEVAGDSREPHPCIGARACGGSTGCAAPHESGCMVGRHFQAALAPTRPAPAPAQAARGA